MWPGLFGTAIGGMVLSVAIDSPKPHIRTNGGQPGIIKLSALVGFGNAGYHKGIPVVNHFESNVFAREFLFQKREPPK